MGAIKKIRYNCKHATYLIEKRQHRSLSIKERIQLVIHLSGCSVCRLFQQQSRLINRMIHGLLRSPENDSHKLDETVKQEMQKKINERLPK